MQFHEPGIRYPARVRMEAELRYHSQGCEMQPSVTRHGCLAVLVSITLATNTGADPPARVQSRVFEIDYEVNEAALPLESVHLWYTLDEGSTWHQYGFDGDAQPPLTFHAPAEGLYGFFVRVTNATGASSDPPTSSSKPHHTAFVDFTPPVVQLHALRQTTMLGQRVLQIRWTAIDAHLPTRPVELEYQRLPDPEWFPVTENPLANTGRYDWRVPVDLLGPVAIRMHVSDKGGHRVTSERLDTEITRPRPTKTLTTTEKGLGPSGLSAGDNIGRPPSEPARKRAREFYKEGLTLRDRGEHRRGVARMREVIRLDPQMTDAFAEMGGMLYLLGDFDRALAAYQMALQQTPTMRAALQGSAKAYRQLQDYASAAQRLRTILRYNPNDAETWMNLGDIGIFQGDEVLARECYLRASRIDPEAKTIIDQARQRLALMAEVSRTYRGE